MADWMKKLSAIRWPEMRWWVAVCTFGLAFTMLVMIRENPALLGIASFAQLSGGIIALTAMVVQNLFSTGPRKVADGSAEINATISASTDQPKG